MHFCTVCMYCLITYDCLFVFIFFFFFLFYFFVFFFFFFFQAEDGIRDGTVTGVQTCALPISGGRRATSRPAPPPGRRAARRGPRGRGPGGRSPDRRRRRSGSRRRARRETGWPRACSATRSEERRVGKEWRTRWSTYEYKEK